MVPGITDTEFRMVAIRYQELRAEVERERRIDTAIPAPPGQAQVMAAIRRSIEAVRGQLRQVLAGVRAHGAAEASPAPGTMAVH